jgi:hypothetical protein
VRGAIVIIFVFFSWKFFSQDTLFFRSGKKVVGKVTEINYDMINYYTYTGQDIKTFHSALKEELTRIAYANGTSDEILLEEKKEKRKTDSLRYKKNFLRLYLSDIFSRVGMGYEYLIKKKYALSLDAYYKFPYGPNWTEKLPDEFYYTSEGSEVRAGLSRLSFLGGTRLAVGFLVSFREQHFSDSWYRTSNGGAFLISQKKRGAGVFLKFNFQFRSQASGLELFVIPGIYAMSTKNTYHAWQAHNQPVISNPSDIPPITAKYMKDGFSLQPYVSFGMSYIIKQPQKDWYQKIERRRDSLNYRKRNIVCLNPIEEFDGCLGMSYWRIFYKQGLTLNAGLAINSGNSSILSNGLLLEKNANYVLDYKDWDASAGINYNFSFYQQSYFFMGTVARVAAFEGRYYYRDFLLDKCYLMGQSGFVVRGNRGLSYIVNIALGGYYNVYNADIHIRPNERTQPYGVAFNFSMQLGFSF